MDRFKGKTVVVTGAAQGIGLAISEQFSQEGATVWMVDLQETLLREASSRVQGSTPWVLDTTDLGSVEEMYRVLQHRHQHCDVLVNNAAVPGEGKLEDLTLEHWNRVMNVNVTAPMLMTQRALPLMKEGSAVVNLSSVAAWRGFAERSLYCASKAAVLGLTRALAVELAPRGVRVNALCPGTIDTPWMDRLVEKAQDPTQARLAYQHRQLLGRMGEGMEIARAVLFLASTDASFITGETLNVDGGMLIRGA